VKLSALKIICLVFCCLTSKALAWDYQSVRTLIEANPNIQRIDQLLEHLDENILNNYLLLHRSNSLQQASLDFPRVILFEGDARFIMAFNGDPKLGGYNRLEMIQFNQAQNQFEFYEARFPESNNGPVVFSEKNPEECQSCHRADLRPNWDAYPFWKDAYGSIEDSARERIDMFPEAKLFQNFLSTAGQNARYKYLPDLKTKSVDIMARQNLIFNKAVGTHNFRRIATYLNTTTEYSKYKFALVGAIRYCAVESFIPLEVRQTFTNDLGYYKDLAIKEDQHIRLERRPFIGESGTFYRPEIIGSLRYLIEGRKIPTGSWSMVLGEESFYLSTGAYGVEELGSVMASLDPELSSTSCEELKLKSLEAFGKTEIEDR
jgi:hypothetical protein